jgi:hypothetical protein
MSERPHEDPAQDATGDGHPALGALQGARPTGAAHRRMVEGALSRRGEREARAWLLPAGGLLAGAAVVAGVLVFGAGPVEAPPAAAPAVVEGASAQPDDVPLGPHRLRPADGALWTALSADPARAEIEVTAGRVGFEVSPLAAGERFRVRTEAATVEVVGTAFTVEVDGACTAVVVSEGRVRVSPTGGAEATLLTPGERARHCAAPPVTALSAPPGADAFTQAAALIAGGGDLSEGARLMESVVQTHPDGPLAGDALYHAFNARARAGQMDRARAHAERYLERFPAGPHAEAIRSWRAAAR